MSRNKKTNQQIHFEDFIKANRKGSREAAFDMSTGFVSVHKAHTSKKTYSRKNFKMEY